MPHFSNKHCATAAVRQEGGQEIIVASAYFQYSEDVEPHIAHLETLLNRTTGKKVLIGADVNAHSSLWHSHPRHLVGRGAEAERRRRAVEDFIQGRELKLWNRSSQPSTFSGPNGESNIEVTFNTQKTCEWRDGRFTRKPQAATTGCSPTQ